MRTSLETDPPAGAAHCGAPDVDAHVQALVLKASTWPQTLFSHRPVAARLVRRQDNGDERRAMARALSGAGGGAMHLNLWSPADPDDEEFHTRVSAGCVIDLDVARLYREEVPRLRRFMGRRLSSDKVPDLIQTAFVRLLGLDRARRNALAEPRAYLTRVARNLVRDEAKFAARRSEQRHLNADDCALAAADPHTLLEARDMLKRVDAAILALPDRTREIFMAHRFEDMTYPQIAARMGVSVKTVEKHISLALRELHRSLGPIG